MGLNCKSPILFLNMRKTSKYAVGIFIMTLFIVCSSTIFYSTHVDDRNILTKELLRSKLDKDVNLLIFSASWCSVSQEILKKEYSKLCSSKNNFNVIIISVDNQLKIEGISCKIYGLKKSVNGFAFSHRRIIKNYIKETLYKTENLNLEGSFGIPVSLFVSRNLDVLTEAPQNAKSIIEVAEYLMNQK